MPGEVLKMSKRYSQPNLSYWRKTNRGPFAPPPPIRSRDIDIDESILKESSSIYSIPSWFESIPSRYEACDSIRFMIKAVMNYVIPIQFMIQAVMNYVIRFNS